MNPYFIIGALGLLITSNVGTFLYKGHLDRIEYDGAIAKQNAVAEGLRADIAQRDADKAARDAEFARNLDEVNAHAKIQIADAARAAGASYAAELRNLSTSWARCRSAAATEAVNSSILTQSVTGRADQLLGEAGDILGEVEGGCNAMKKDLADFRTWALKHGR